MSGTSRARFTALLKGRPWCSVIIPTLNEADHLAATLAALGPGWPEIIISDGGSTDGTQDLARTQGAIIVEGAKGRATQLNAGAKVATGKWLYFLHADTLVAPQLALHLRAAAADGWPACCCLAFARDEGREKRYSTALGINSERIGRIWDTACLSLFGRLSKLPFTAFRFGDQSLFVSRRDFDAVGGYRPDHLLLEGNDIVRRLKRLRGDFRVLPLPVITSARRYEEHGVVFTQAVYVLIYTLYRLGCSQDRLVSIYRAAFPTGT